MNTTSGVARPDRSAPFSIGNPSPPPRRSARLSRNLEPTRRSTRQAALDANILILESLEMRTRRRQRRLLTQPSTLQQEEAIPNGVGAGRKDSPILLDDVESDDEAVDENQKMPAVPNANDLNDFVCAICLDCPATLSELATISGCTHRFCFECIDTWAKTENKCPCCKARFRTIDRVAPLPLASGGRRDKRKRGGIGSARSPRRRTEGVSASSTPVNSRSVEDRNQPSTAMLNVAFIERVLEQFSSLAADRGDNDVNGVFQLGGPAFSFTNAGGRPVVTISRAGGSIELFLADQEGEGGRPGRGRVRYNPTTEAASASGAAAESAAIGSRERSHPFVRGRREAVVGSARPDTETGSVRARATNGSAGSTSVAAGAAFNETNANISFGASGASDPGTSSRLDTLSHRLDTLSNRYSQLRADVTGINVTVSSARSRYVATRSGRTAMESALNNSGSSPVSVVLRMSTARSTRGSVDEPIDLID
ncbi:hypothetical protein HJC23_005403 [Cyclotella cryptica]|uniref:RING-type domain-containing protein n=1 Tax=Cyclotella cryptica TaxID=29204 RepID=A0ABD3P337_9STRA|eukprot:CCRYP_018239-RA/>CCRYP_018239-RA protein AED:0.13 eAED:0.13 QI:0/-1/0/1/-1/1/1/0/481